MSLALMLGAVSGISQEVVKGRWSEVTRLKPDTRTEVITLQSERVKGRFVSAAPDSVVIRTRGQERSFARPDVREIKIRSFLGRARNAGVGGASGAGAGLLLGGLFVWSTGISELAPGFLVAATIVGGTVGASIGVLIPGYRTIYKVRTP
jgi:hypothetical protein